MVSHWERIHYLHAQEKQNMLAPIRTLPKARERGRERMKGRNQSRKRGKEQTTSLMVAEAPGVQQRRSDSNGAWHLKSSFWFHCRRVLLHNTWLLCEWLLYIFHSHQRKPSIQPSISIVNVLDKHQVGSWATSQTSSWPDKETSWQTREDSKPFSGTTIAVFPRPQSS